MCSSSSSPVHLTCTSVPVCPRAHHTMPLAKSSHQGLTSLPRIDKASPGTGARAVSPGRRTIVTCCRGPRGLVNVQKHAAMYQAAGAIVQVFPCNFIRLHSRVLVKAINRKMQRQWIFQRAALEPLSRSLTSHHFWYRKTQQPKSYPGR
jgi:hypothetical protein